MQPFAMPFHRTGLQLNSTHLHIITSLGEGNPTTIWEAMDRGIPTVSLNHCGMKDVICDKCGVKINIETTNAKYFISCV